MNPETISIVIEWENVLLAEMARCRKMLRELRRQILLLANSGPNVPGVSFEVLVVHDETVVETVRIERELERELPAAPGLAVRCLAARDLHYYELKNFGARHSRGAVIVFLDSDVVPEADWLRNLLGCFDDPKIQVAGGSTYVDPAGVWGKALALTWFFPLRSAESGMAEVPNFYANNVGFRSETFAKFPFPKLGETSRGACVKLAAILRQNGISIHRQAGAWVNHPPPDGLRHLAVRGLVHGRDELLGRRAARGRASTGKEIASQASRCLKELARSLNTIVRHRRKVGLPLVQTPVAVAIALAYYQFRLAGGLMTHVMPGIMTRHFRI